MIRSNDSISFLLVVFVIASGCAESPTNRDQEPGSSAPAPSVSRSTADSGDDRSVAAIEQALAQVVAELDAPEMPLAVQGKMLEQAGRLPNPNDIAPLKSLDQCNPQACETLQQLARAMRVRLSVHANNLANVSTVAFKRNEVLLKELPHHQIAHGSSVGSGCRVIKIRTVFQPGPTRETFNRTDLAIEGGGFFKVTSRANGEERYTRDGSFHPDATGTLVTSDGYVLDGNITVPAFVPMSSVHIGSDGTVAGDTAWIR